MCWFARVVSKHLAVPYAIKQLQILTGKSPWCSLCSGDMNGALSPLYSKQAACIHSSCAHSCSWLYDVKVDKTHANAEHEGAHAGACICTDAAQEHLAAFESGDVESAPFTIASTFLKPIPSPQKLPHVL